MSAKPYVGPNSDDDIDEEGLSEDFESEEDFLRSDEEEEEEIHLGKGQRKRKHSGPSGFILDEAEVDDLEEESSEAEEGYEDLIKEEKQKQNLEREYVRKHQAKFVDFEDEKQLKELVAKYENRAIVDDLDTGPRPMTAIEKQKLLPGINNPYLWMVRCQMGEERKLAFLLMRKALKCAANNEPLKIKSVIQLDRLRGHLYIEAYKATHVKQAIESIYQFRFGFYNQKMVPIEEMTDALRVVSEVGAIAPKTWVRFKNGLHKDDLALVKSFDQIKNMAIVYMVPRLDYSELNIPGSKPGKKRRLRPTAALFDRDKAQAAGIELTSEGGGHLSCRGRRFKNGLQIKRVHVSSLLVNGIAPILKELEKFNGVLDASDLAQTVSAKAQCSFTMGDVVQVTGGELTNLLGVVTSITGSTITVRPRHAELKEDMEFGSHELIKYFKVGDHVKVISGQFKDESGVVVRIEDSQAVILSDISIKEINVLTKDIQLCSEKSVAYDDAGQFTIHDYVQIDPQTIGVVVDIEHDLISVLDQFNKLQKIKPSSLTKKNMFAGMFIDQFNNTISSGDTVKVMEGPHLGTRGKFKFFYRGFVFVYSKMIAENANMFVTRSKNLAVDSASSNSTSASFSSPVTNMSPRHGTTPKVSGNYVGLGRSPTAKRLNDMKRDKGLIGSTVRIIKGAYKGHIGIVKNFTSAMARIELHTNSRSINVDRNNLSICGDKLPSANVSKLIVSALKNQSVRDQVMAGSQTPVHDITKTPGYGGMTPGQDGSATPIHHGDAWDKDATHPAFSTYFDDTSEFSSIFNDMDTPMSANKESSVSFRPESHVFSKDDFLNTSPSSADSPMISTFPIPSPLIGSGVSDGSATSASQMEFSSDSSPAIVSIKPIVSYSVGTIVTISHAYTLPNMAGKYAVVIKSIGSNEHYVKPLNDKRQFDTDQKVLSIESRFLNLATPVVGGKVKIDLDNMELYGTLIEIDLNDGVVELDDISKKANGEYEDVSIFLLKQMTPYIPVE